MKPPAPGRPGAPMAFTSLAQALASGRPPREKRRRLPRAVGPFSSRTRMVPTTAAVPGTPEGRDMLSGITCGRRLTLPDSSRMSPVVPSSSRPKWRSWFRRLTPGGRDMSSGTTCAPSAPSAAYSRNGFGADGTADANPAYRPQPSAYRPQGDEPKSLVAQGFGDFADDADDADGILRDFSAAPPEGEGAESS